MGLHPLLQHHPKQQPHKDTDEFRTVMQLEHGDIKHDELLLPPVVIEKRVQPVLVWRQVQVFVHQQAGKREALEGMVGGRCEG